MAAARHNPTRRAVLGAAASLPAWLAAAPAVAQGRMETRWDRALAAYRRAETVLAAYYRNVAGPAERRFQMVRGRWPQDCDFTAELEAKAELAKAWEANEAIEHRFGDLACARLTALRRLLRAPAPDLPALALKIELVVDHEVATLDGGEQCLAVLKADGMRLARAAIGKLSPKHYRLHPGSSSPVQRSRPAQ